MSFSQFWARWKEPITAVSIVFSISIGIYGGYEQREQTILAEKQWQLALENSQHTKANPPPVSMTSVKPMVANVSIFPFVLSSLSPLLLFGILVAMYRQYNKAGRSHHERLYKLELLQAERRLKELELATELGVASPGLVDSKCAGQRDEVFNRILSVEDMRQQNLKSVEGRMLQAMGKFSLDLQGGRNSQFCKDRGCRRFKTFDNHET